MSYYCGCDELLYVFILCEFLSSVVFSSACESMLHSVVLLMHCAASEGSRAYRHRSAQNVEGIPSLPSLTGMPLNPARGYGAAL